LQGITSNDRSPDSAPRAAGLVCQILVVTGCRLLLNTARRFAYPFAPVLGRGLQVPLTSITSILAVSQLTGFIGFLGGPLADRWGYRRMMLVGLGLLAVGMLSVGFVPIYLIAFLGLVLAGIGKTLFDPAVYGYTSRSVPFSQRGRVTGLMEFSWAASALIGIPLAGVLMEKQGWQAPFWYMGLLGVIGVVCVWKLIPRDRPATSASDTERFGEKVLALIGERRALGLMGMVFFMSIGNDQLFVVYAAWMEDAYKVSIVTLGLGTGVIGAAELCGESFTALIADRVGLRKAALVGTSLSILGYLILPVFSKGLPSALGGLFFIFLVFEFSMVCGISLSTEVLPGSRATMMAAFYSAAGVGRMIGAFIGGPVWLMGGVVAVTSLSAMVSAAGLACLVWGGRMQRNSNPTSGTP
jgi:DHA1 family inner membrane transport protein